MRRISALGLLLAVTAIFLPAAYGQQANTTDHIDPWFKPTTITFKDTPLPQAIEQLTKGLGVDYNFTRIAKDPAELKVTAVFRNVPLESALKQTITSAGLNYMRGGDQLTIYDPAWDGNSAYGGYRPSNASDYWNQFVQADFRDVRFADAVKKILEGTPATYTIPPDLEGQKVNLNYGGNTFRRQALGYLGQGANIGYKTEGDKITFYPGYPGMGVYKKDGRDTVNLSFADTAFAKAIEQLFRGTKTTYRVRPGLEDVKVNAKLGEMPLDEALKQVMDAAGATYKKEGEAYVFSPAVGRPAPTKPGAASKSPEAQSQTIAPAYVGDVKTGTGKVVVSPRSQTVFAGTFDADSWGPDEDGLHSAHPSYKTYETITLKYVDASAVIPLASLEPNLLVAKTGMKFVTVHGKPAAIKRFKETISLVDRPESMPRAVRVTVTGRVTTTGPRLTGQQEPAVYSLVTESVTAEGMRASSQATAQGLVADGNSLSVNVIPTIVDARPEDNTPTTISLFGNGVMTGRWPVFSRTFDILASVEPKKEATIASGSMDIAGGAVSFTVTAVADIEPGRVRLPSNDPAAGNVQWIWDSRGNVYQNNLPRTQLDPGGEALMQQFLKSGQTQTAPQADPKKQTPPAQQKANP